MNILPHLLQEKIKYLKIYFFLAIVHTNLKTLCWIIKIIM